MGTKITKLGSPIHRNSPQQPSPGPSGLNTPHGLGYQNSKNHEVDYDHPTRPELSDTDHQLVEKDTESLTADQVALGQQILAEETNPYSKLEVEEAMESVVEEKVALGNQLAWEQKKLKKKEVSQLE